MNWNFDTLFFLGFGILCLYLGLSRSKWLFWGSSHSERMELALGKRYRQIINICCGLLCLGIGAWFLLR